MPLVTEDTFPAPGDEFVTVVHFFHPDEANEKAAKAVQAVAGKLSPSRLAKFAAVDCRAHAALCERHEVVSTPAIKAAVPDDGDLVDYTGRVATGDLKAWTLRQIPSHVTTLSGQADLDQFLQVRAARHAVCAVDEREWRCRWCCLRGSRGPLRGCGGGCGRGGAGGAACWALATHLHLE